MTDLPASWQPDPTGRHDHRYWDGHRWTDHVADAGVADTDVYTEPAPAPEPEPTPAAEAEPTAAATDPAPTLSWSPPTPTPTTPATPVEPDPVPQPGPAAGAAPASASGWSTPSEPAATSEPEAPATPAVTGWAPAASPSSTDAPTEVTSTPDYTQPLPVLPTTAASTDFDPPSIGADPVAATAGGDGPGHGRRNLLIGVGVLVVVALVAFLALTGDDDDSSTAAVSGRIADSLQDTASGLSGDDADCVADKVVDDVGAGRLKDFDSATPSGDLGADYLDALDKAARECKVTNLGTFGGTTDGSADGGTDDTSVPDIGDPDSFRDLLADQYEGTLGLPRDKAECLADAMGDAVQQGQLDQQDSFNKFFDYLDACDIALEEITGQSP